MITPSKISLMRDCPELPVDNSTTATPAPTGYSK
jgi:hypothetical protein